MSSRPPHPSAPPFEVVLPDQRALPLVFASPHSGSHYPRDFLDASALDAHMLRRSEDSFVDQLFVGAAHRGAPLLRALFPRAFIDPNREPYELDPTMFEDSLPAYANTRSPRVAAGLGTIARVVATGAEIYGSKLRYAQAADRIKVYYRPYHDALRGLIDGAVTRWGHCILIDCHSMPGIGGPFDHDHGHARMDFVLGDCFGLACTPHLIDKTERVLTGLGYVVTRNNPYAGGFTTRHYGRPRQGVHALQIEINRALYMNEQTNEKTAYFATLQANLNLLIDALAEFALTDSATWR